MSVFGEASIEAAVEAMAALAMSDKRRKSPRATARVGLAAAEGAVDREALAQTLAQARWDRPKRDRCRLSLRGQYLATAREDVAALFPTERPEPEHDCETELKSRPDYSPCHGSPALFDCSCGKRYAYGSEESEGAAWDLVEPA